jgi:hypothetical protein
VSIKGIGAVFTNDCQRLVAVEFVAENGKDVSNILILDGKECL